MAETYYHPLSNSAESSFHRERRECIESATIPLTITTSAEGLIPQECLYEANSFIGQGLVADTRASCITSRLPYRVDGFPDKQTLAGFFPRIDDDEKTSFRIRISKRNLALLLQVTLIGTIFAINLFILLYASSKYPSRDGVGLLFAGDCDTVKSGNRWLHLLINVLSTGMLSASTFCIQLQSSPTRADIDKAHRQNRWLDIGAPSLRNLRHIGGCRLGSCLVLALSSLPIHLIFNSAVFQSLASNDYSVAVVADSFLSGGGWDLSTAEHNRQGDPGWDERTSNPPDVDYRSIVKGMQNDVVGGLYEMKNVSDCYALYEDYWSAQQGNVVVVVKNDTGAKAENDSLLLYTFVTPRYDNYAKNLWAANNGTETTIAFSPAPPPVTILYLGPQHYEASYCLVEFAKASSVRCRLEYSTHILYTVTGLNFLKLCALVFVWTNRKRAERRRKAKREAWGAAADVEERILAQREAVLSTLGDAIASFMQEPDETTKNMCLATKYDFLQNKSLFCRKEKQESEVTSASTSPATKYEFLRKITSLSWQEKPAANVDPHPRKWKMSRKRWMSATTPSQWACLILLYIIFLVALYTSMGLLVTSLKNRDFDLTFAFFRSLGFGAVSALTYLNLKLPRGDPDGLLFNVLIINSPQLLFSIMYAVCGAVVTTFLVQREFSLMYTRAARKPLRVSEPVGIQRSSFFISVPLRYGIPLNVYAAVFHWLISQSFFLARVTALLPDGTEDYGNSFSTLGYSPYAIIITGIIAFAHITTIVLLGCRKYDGTMSMVSTNSMAISAACHGLPEDRESGHLLPLQWGVVEIGEDGVGHCAFTTAPCHAIRKAEEDVLYQ